MISIRANRYEILIDFNEYDDYESFDEIISVFKNNFSLIINEQLDGPESRVWFLLLDNIEVSLHNNPDGNYLKIKLNNVEIDDLLYKIRTCF